MGAKSYMDYKINSSNPGEKIVHRHAKKKKSFSQMRKYSALFQLYVPHKHSVYKYYFRQNQAADVVIFDNDRY